MRAIVDSRLGDVYRPRSSSHLIYAGSRHNPGCVRHELVIPTVTDVRCVKRAMFPTLEDGEPTSLWPFVAW